MKPMSMSDSLPPELVPLVQRAVEILRGEATKYVTVDKLPDIRLDSAVFAEVTDPANGQPGYEGVWRNALNERVGQLIVNSDGSFFAEYDLCVRHPRKPDWFIEAVTAWGRGSQIKAEPRLLALP